MANTKYNFTIEAYDTRGLGKSRSVYLDLKAETAEYATDRAKKLVHRENYDVVHIVEVTNG